MTQRLPKKIYLERWPKAAERDDSIHYEPIGYGDDLRGHTSKITVYVRESDSQRASARTVQAFIRELLAAGLTRLGISVALKKLKVRIKAGNFR